MAELWQSYGTWILYGLFFIVMVLLHGRMHGHAGHSHAGRARNAVRSPVDGGLEPPSGSGGAGHAHGDEGRPARTRRGCC